MSNNKFKILIIEDEANICSFIQTLLETNGYQALVAQTCVMGMTMFISYNPDLVILDLGLPDRDGLDAIRSIRQKYLTPIIVLSARTTEQDKIEALDLGANDYITKPFGTGELMARIRTSLRHSHAQAPGHVYKALDLEIDFEKRLIRLRGEEVHLTQIEYQLLTLLAENSGRVLTYSYIMNAIWGPYMDNNNQILRVNMANIRRKLEQNPAQPQYVFTEIGVGYRMRENENGGTV